MVGESLTTMTVIRIDIPSKANLPDMWEDIQPHFPLPSPRKYQDDALSVAWWALENDDFDNVVIEAPTGIGKSAIAMTIQTRFQSAYLLTPTLGLTEQYRRDCYHVLKEVRGRSNFPCWVTGTAKGVPWPEGRSASTSRERPTPVLRLKVCARDSRLVLSNPASIPSYPITR